MARSVRVFVTMLALVATLACGAGDLTHEDQRAVVETALDTLAADLRQNRPPDIAAYRERRQSYLDANPDFFGSAAALLDPSGRVVASPYVYRALAKSRGRSALAANTSLSRWRKRSALMSRACGSCQSRLQ